MTDSHYVSEPKWWQFLARFRKWRYMRQINRALIGRTIHFNGQTRTIVGYDPTTKIATMDQPPPENRKGDV